MTVAEEEDLTNAEKQSHEERLASVGKLTKKDLGLENDKGKPEFTILEPEDEMFCNNDSVEQYINDKRTEVKRYAASLVFDDFCKKCKKKPCEWYGCNYVFVANTYAAANPCGANTETLERSQLGKSQSTHRKILYGMLHRIWVNGAVGTGRIKFPECVVDHVCVLFPLPTQTYMGFCPY